VGGNKEQRERETPSRLPPPPTLPLLSHQLGDVVETGVGRGVEDPQAAQEADAVGLVRRRRRAAVGAWADAGDGVQGVGRSAAGGRGLRDWGSGSAGRGAAPWAAATPSPPAPTLMPRSGAASLAAAGGVERQAPIAASAAAHAVRTAGRGEDGRARPAARW